MTKNGGQKSRDTASLNFMRVQLKIWRPVKETVYLRPVMMPYTVSAKKIVQGKKKMAYKNCPNIFFQDNILLSCQKWCTLDT